MWPKLQETADLVTFTEENLNGKLRFLCSEKFDLSGLLTNSLPRFSHENWRRYITRLKSKLTMSKTQFLSIKNC